MKSILNTVLLFVIALAVVGCDDPNYPAADSISGTLSFNGFALTAVDTTITTSIDVADFVVNVKNANTDEIVATWRYAELPCEMTLVTGLYIVEAYNATVQPAAWDAPYYYASAQARVYEDEATVVNPLQCTLSNVKVGVYFTDAFRAAMGGDVQVAVTMAQGSTLVFTPDEARSGYFEYMTGASTLSATLTGTVGGVETMNHQVLTGVTAGQSCRITFSLDDE